MNNRHFHAILLLLPLLALVSCTSDYTPDIEGTPVVVVNILAEPDSLLRASVTRSRPFAKPTQADYTLRNAQVSLNVNGTDRGLMTFDPATRTFVGDYTPSPSDHVAVSVVDPAIGSASASTVIPSRPVITSWSYEPMRIVDFNSIVMGSDGQIDYMSKLKIRYSITISDPAGEENYYLIRGRVFHDTAGGGSSDDPILGENDTPLDAIFSDDKRFIVFSDRSIDGRDYTFSYTTTYWPYIDIFTMTAGPFTDRIEVCSISRDYYLYLLSIYKKYGNLNSNLEDLGLNEPKILYTNITGGAGILASQAPVLIVNDVDSLVCDFTGIPRDHY